MIEFIKAGIEGREYAKFVFTRSLSDALSLIKQLGGDAVFRAEEDCSISELRRHPHTLYSESGSVRDALLECVARGREQYALTRNLVLPPINQRRPTGVFAFHLPPSQPNLHYAKKRHRTSRLSRRPAGELRWTDSFFIAKLRTWVRLDVHSRDRRIRYPVRLA